MSLLQLPHNSYTTSSHIVWILHVRLICLEFTQCERSCVRVVWKSLSKSKGVVTKGGITLVLGGQEVAKSAANGVGQTLSLIKGCGSVFPNQLLAVIETKGVAKLPYNQRKCSAPSTTPARCHGPHYLIGFKHLFLVSRARLNCSRNIMAHMLL